MTTKIIEFDILSPPSLPDAGWPGYSNIFVLLKRGSRTLGGEQLPLADGHVDRYELDRVVENAASQCGYLLVRERFQVGDADRGPEIAVSVVICTRDRARHLDRCLQALANSDPKPMEVLVIDNASTDQDTAKVAERHRVRYVREDRPGLNWARARGALSAKGEIVAYIDDDVSVTPGWLAPFASAFRDPSLTGLTGLVLPYALDDPAAEMFEKYCGFVRGFERRSFTLSSMSPMASANVGAGACMAFRRDVLNQLKLFEIELDAGTAACTGGDTYAFYRLITLGYRIDYEPDIVVRHKHRDSEGAVVSTLRGYSLGTYVFYLHCFLRHGDVRALIAGLGWFRSHHLRQLFRGLLRKPDAQPLKLTFAEIQGCFAAPLAYVKTRLKDRRHHPSGVASNEARVLP